MKHYSEKKILIVDDEPSVRSLVKRLLSKENYIVLEANDGEEAVNATRIWMPDLILMDILMPKMDGLTACYTIKTDRHTNAIPVVMLTAVDHELNKKLSQDVLAADGYITKPFSRHDLIAIIGQFLTSSK